MSRLGEQPVIHPTAQVTGCRFGTYVEVGAYASLEETALGDYSYVMQGVIVWSAEIGKFCNIAAYTRITVTWSSRLAQFRLRGVVVDHPTWAAASTSRLDSGTNHPMGRAIQHHFTYRSVDYGLADTDDAAFFAWRRAHRVTLGHDVWLGHGAIVLPGVTVGTGAVVSRDVPAYTVVAGVPARPIRRRVDEETEQRLRRLAWWDWPHDQLRQALPAFRSLDAKEFCDRFGS